MYLGSTWSLGATLFNASAMSLLYSWMNPANDAMSALILAANSFLVSLPSSNVLNVNAVLLSASIIFLAYWSAVPFLSWLTAFTAM